MEHGPLPPHERIWRHPSELAAEERAVVRAEAAAPSTRVFALTTGTIGLLAVAVLILTVSPARRESPVAISATTTPAPADGAAGRALRPAALSSAPVGSPDSRAGRLTEAQQADALATPIGDGRFALVTGRAVAGRNSRQLDVRLASGRVISAEIVSADADVVVVALADAEPGHAIARQRPHAHDLVTVMASPPITVVYADVDGLAIDEGVAVLDDDGAVVALCSRGGGRGVELLEVTEEVAGATTGGR